MHIAIDASRATSARATGTEHYARALIRALIALDADDLTLYFRDQPPADLFPASPRVTRRVIPLARAWTHLRFAAELLRGDHDLVWVPAHTLPFVLRGRAAVTLHDLGYKHFPEAHPPMQRAYLDLTTRYSAARANIILADSQATAADLTHFYGTPTDKIAVVYPGVEAPASGSVEAVRAKYNIPPRYLLFIGTLQPRKNIARLVRAFARYRSTSGDGASPDAVALVLAGGRGWLFDEAWIAGVDGVITTGYIDEADKGALYAGALGLAFPSLYEGFGFPVIEAMLCGCPVLCSSTSSLPELAGDAALLVDPLDEDAITAGLARLASDAALRETLIARGRDQAARFTWERAAQAARAAFARAAFARA